MLEKFLYETFTMDLEIEDRVYENIEMFVSYVEIGRLSEDITITISASGYVDDNTEYEYHYDDILSQEEFDKLKDKKLEDFEGELM